MTDTQRAAFEAWAKERMLDVQRSVLGDDYVSFITNLVWAGWKAAQAADAGREAVAYETTDANGDQELLYASYLAKQSTEEERARFMVPLYYEPNAYRLAAINAELVEALEACTAAMLARGVSTDPEHPDRIASAAESFSNGLSRLTGSSIWRASSERFSISRADS